MGVTNLIGQGPMAKFGRNEATTSGEVVQDEGGAVLIRTAEGDVEIVSGSTEDDTGGDGAITVKIFGADDGLNPIEEVITLNGQGVVDLVKKYRYIYRAKVLTSGVTNTNEGDITIRVKSAGATLAMITAGYGQTEKAMFIVFAGCKYEITKFRFDGVRIGTLTGEVALCEYDEGGAKRVIHALSFAGSSNHFIVWEHGHKVIEEKTLVWIEAKNMSASGYCTASFDGNVIRYKDPV